MIKSAGSIHDHEYVNLDPRPANTYNLLHHAHGDHVHFSLIKNDSLNHESEDDHSDHDHEHDHAHDHEHEHEHEHHHDHDDHSHDEHCEPCENHDHSGKKKIGKNDEGCPCCTVAIDLDEVAVALNEISAKSGELEGEKGSALGQSADYSSAAHWGIFLGISGPLALIGLTAAYRNIKGTINNKSKLEAVIKGLEEDIASYKDRAEDASGQDKEDLSGVVKRLEAFKETLNYSKFDAKFNLAVPGFINGAASAAILSSAAASSFWALPIIALYAGCQTTRNAYDLWRTWNKILPENIRKQVELNVKVGIRKINQITDSKRKFYATNTFGFSVFTTGAIVTTLSALSVVGSVGMIVGIPLLAAGAIATGITNNIWTIKFRPRNSDLGIDRKELDLERITQEIGHRRELKKILKNYKEKHLPSKALKRFGGSLLSSMPFGQKKGASLLHGINQSRISSSDSTDADRLDLLERIINAKIVLQSNKKEADSILKKISALEKISDDERNKFALRTLPANQSLCENIFTICQELEIDTIVLERFIKNAIIKSLDEHDDSVKTKEQYFEKLQNSNLFHINNEEITFDIKALEKYDSLKKAFMNSLEECLLFDYVEKLKYEQYGLNDFYWALEKQNKRLPHSHEHKHHKHNHHKHSHDHSHDHSHSCADKAKEHNHGHHEHRPHQEHSNHVEHSNHENLCRPCHLPSLHQRKQSVVKHDHSHHEHHEHHEHEHHPACDSKALAEDQKSVIPETEQKLLSEFKSLTKIKISLNKEKRQNQITKQNKVIDQVLERSREFVLESRVENHENNQTIFTYLDPDHTDPDDPDYKEKQVIYIQNNSTGKIDVFYGTKARALVIERPNEVKNGAITKIDEKKLEHYGEINDSSSFQSFENLDLSKALPTGGLREAKSLSLTKSNKSLVHE